MKRSLDRKLQEVEEGGRGRRLLMEKIERKVNWLEGRLAVEDCGKMEQVISCAGERNIRAGWYCFKCRRWINAIGRERIVENYHGNENQ